MAAIGHPLPDCGPRRPEPIGVRHRGGERPVQWLINCQPRRAQAYGVGEDSPQNRERIMALSDFPRYPLLFGPSPVHPLERLSDHLGGARIWAKREDCNSGLAFGGNKTRKLEYLVPDALAQGATHLVSIGGVQSNHTRQVAAVAAKLGLKARLVQESWVDWPDCGERPGRQHPAVADHGRARRTRRGGVRHRLQGELGERAGRRSAPTAASRTRSRPARPTTASAAWASPTGRTRCSSRSRNSASSSTRSSSAASPAPRTPG